MNSCIGKTAKSLAVGKSSEIIVADECIFLICYFRLFFVLTVQALSADLEKNVFYRVMKWAEF